MTMDTGRILDSSGVRALAYEGPGTTSTASGGPLLASQLKVANGLGGGSGHDLLAPPPGSLSGTASPGTTAELQGLLLQHSQHQLQHHPHLHHGQLTVVKREPEDLSHHRQKNTGSPENTDSGIIIKGVGGGLGSRHKVVLVSAANGGASDLVVDVANNNNNTTIKEELQQHSAHASSRSLHSPQHGSRSVNGTPTSSTSSLLADGGGGGPLELITADGLKTGMAYTSQMFTTMGATTHHGSGTPSPTPYADQYATTAVSQGYLTSSGAIRAPISTTAAFAVTDPYYAREYFSEQGYSSQGRQQQVPSYADSPEAGGGSTTSTASYVERYVVRPSTGYHGSKSVVSSAAAAGLTVDLPSPDSGIGTDAITPRDQTTIQQVSGADASRRPSVLLMVIDISP
uniref:Uncharacterized protein n=1 Tax=Timema douglasi TaxID=61478 RepID=A0A7R8VGY0_TIMDO|nr:unnamed protein product [Timema douglasi]